MGISVVTVSHLTHNCKLQPCHFYCRKTSTVSCVFYCSHRLIVTNFCQLAAIFSAAEPQFFRVLFATKPLFSPRRRRLSRIFAAGSRL